jgi:hypothetical protein
VRSGDNTVVCECPMKSLDARRERFVVQYSTVLVEVNKK